MLTPDEDQARRARTRECAVELLELSSVYENVIIPPGCPVEWPIVVAIVARQRSHLKAVLQLADAGLALALATTALAAIAAAASGGATAPEASTKPDLGKSLARLVRAAARPREYERRVLAFFDSALAKGGAK